MHFAVCRHDNRTQGQRIAYLHYVPNQRNTDQFLARLGIIQQQQHGVLTNFDHLPSKVNNCGHTVRPRNTWPQAAQTLTMHIFK